MKLRFFCDLCGTEVPRNTVRCPSCGRFFTAIQCPRCHFRGEEKDFEKGCPRCGYMKIPRTGGPTAADGSAGGRSGRRAEGRGRRRRQARVKRSRGRIDQGPVAPAPVGLYRLISIILVAILLALALVLLTR